MYDLQAPGFYLPYPVVPRPGPISRPSAGAYLKVVVMGLAAAGVFVLGWWIRVPVLHWILMLVGGFFATVILFLLGILIFRPEPRHR